MTTLELDRATGWVELLAPVAELATQVAGTDFVPAALRNKPAAVAACILYGHELGIGPMEALQSIHVIDGRPIVSAQLARKLAHQGGVDVWVEQTSNVACTACGRRRGSETTFRVVWTMDDAKRARLDGKSNWRSYPRAMLIARATAELIRTYYADVLGGFQVEDEPDTTVAELEAELPQPAKRTARRAPKALEPPEAATSPVEPPAPSELAEVAPGAPPITVDHTAPVHDEPEDAPAPLEPEAALPRRRLPGSLAPKEDRDTMTPAQRAHMMAGFHELGMEDRDRRLRLTCALVGRQVGSANELTRAEASTVIDALVAITDGRAHLVLDPEEGYAVVYYDEGEET